MDPKIKDVAEKAGVAPSTVSRVLNNPEKVSPETLAKVNHAIKRLGFRPNMLARSMRTGKTSTIAVVLPDLTNLFFPELVWGIEKAAQKQGYRLFICNSDESPEREAHILTDLSHRNVDGIILSSVGGEGGNLDQIEELSRRIPLVMVDRDVSYPGANAVTADGFEGVYNAASYFLASGHSEIAFISGPLQRDICVKRYLGFRKALEDHGRDLDPELVIEANFKSSGGRWAAEMLMKKNRLPTAIIAANDMMAIGVLKVLQSSGVRIPEDVEIIGFDNIFLADLTIPSLSTVAQPIEEMGVEAVRLLFAKMRYGEESAERVVLKTSLIHRETTLHGRRAAGGQDT